MKKSIFTVLALGMLLASAAVRAEEKQLQSLKPVVQTAKWAVKWWMPRHKQKLAEVKKAEGKFDLVMIGDSITHEWENGKAQSTWKKYYASRNALNIGFSGDRTEHVIWRLQNGAVEGVSPKLVVIMIGTNNAGHRQEKSEHTAAGVGGVLEEVRKRMPKAKVLLLAIFPRGEKPQDKLRQLNIGTNNFIAKFADNKHVFFLDINKKFLTPEGLLTKQIMPDRLHLNGKGYAIWAEAMEPMVKKLMANSK